MHFTGGSQCWTQKTADRPSVAHNNVTFIAQMGRREPVSVRWIVAPDAHVPHIPTRPKHDSPVSRTVWHGNAGRDDVALSCVDAARGSRRLQRIVLPGEADVDPATRRFIDPEDVLQTVAVEVAGRKNELRPVVLRNGLRGA